MNITKSIIATQSSLDLVNECVKICAEKGHRIALLQNGRVQYGEAEALAELKATLADAAKYFGYVKQPSKQRSAAAAAARVPVDAASRSDDFPSILTGNCLSQLISS